MADFPKPTPPTPMKNPPKIGWRNPGGGIPIPDSWISPGVPRYPDSRGEPAPTPAPKVPWPFPVPSRGPRPDGDAK